MLANDVVPDENGAPLLYDSEEYDSEIENDKAGALSAVVLAATGRDLSSRRERREALEVEPTAGKEDGLAAPVARNRSGRDAMESMLAALDGASGTGDVDALRKRVKRQSSSGRAPLDAPLPDAVAGRIERAAAYDKTKTEVTDKWAQVVQENRKARTLNFPLGAAKTPTYPQTSDKVSTYEARTDFEKEITELLQEGGVEGERDVAKKEEDELRSKVSKEEVMQRRRELARMRSLVFEHERKMKRISKIKSKRFRKIMKNEKLRVQEEMTGSDGEDALEERLKSERRRAEERMTLRHKNTSKWIKRQLQRGEAKRNPDARAAIEEQLRMGEELRRRQEGIMELSGFDRDGSDRDIDDMGSDVDELESELDSIRKDLLAPAEEKGKKKLSLSNMKFMQAAKERERKEALQLLNEIGDDEAEDGLDEYGSDGAQARDAGRVTFNGGRTETTQMDAGEPEEEVDSAEEARVREEYEDDAKEQRIGGGEMRDDVERIVREAADAPKGFVTTLKGRISADVAVGGDGKQVESSSAAALRQVELGESGESDEEEPVVKQTQQMENRDGSNCKDKRAKRKASGKPEPRGKKARKVRVFDDETQTPSTAAEKPASDSKPAAAEKPETKPKAPTSALEADRARMSMVAQAFAGLGGADEEEFAASKAAEIDAEVDAETKADAAAAPVLPGWGTWDGAGTRKKRKKSAFAEAAERRLTEARANAIARRADKDHPTLQLSSSRNKAARALTLGAVPFPFRNVREWERELSIAAVPELAAAKAFRSRIAPEVTVRPGVAIDPIQHDGRRKSDPAEKMPVLRPKTGVNKRKGKGAVLERRKRNARAREGKRKALLS